MNKYKKYSIYTLSFIIFVLIFIFVGYKRVDSPILSPNENQKQNDVIVPREEIKTELSKEKKVIKEAIESESLMKVSLMVPGKNYQTQIKENATVFEVMNKIEKEDADFNFKYTEHKSMGVFVTEINGSVGKPGMYWIYYINDKKPGVGISKYILKEGDIIKWSQEGI